MLAIGITVIATQVLVPHFLTSSSPLGKTIEVTFVYPDQTSIGAGLSVDLWNQVGIVDTQITDATGKVVFAGLVDETYTWKWSWQGIADSHSEIIDCSKIVWPFTQEVAYWTVEKTFLYKDGTTPIEGLDVTLMPAGPTLKTDALGFVSFVDVKAGSYTLEWMWDGLKTHAFSIVFTTESPYDLGTNLLPLKSG